MRTAILLLLAPLVLLTGLSTSARAEWSIDPTGNLAVCTQPGRQALPRTIPDGEGGLFVAWVDNREELSKIYAQRIGADGTILWAADGVRICTYPSEQSRAVLTSDGAGGIIVAWQDDDESIVNLYAQRLDADGNLLWPTSGMTICAESGDQIIPAIDADGQGGAVIVWWDKRTDSGDIYAQRIDADGDRVWPYAGVPVCTATGWQWDMQVVSDGSGGAAICWNDERDPAGESVYVQRLDAAGTAQWTADGELVVTDATDTTGPILVSDGTGGCYVAFHDFPTAEAMAVRVQHVDSGGARLWGDAGIAPAPETQRSLAHSAAAADPDGGLFLAWTIEGADGSYDQRAQSIAPNGAFRWGADGLLLVDASGDQHSPFIVPDTAGGAYFGWRDDRTGGFDYTASVYAQRLDSYGDELWNENGNVIQLGSTMGWPTGCLDDRGGLLVVWEDARGVDFDLYAGRLDDTGHLGDPAPALTSIIDFPNDQGGVVNLFWDPGYLDALPWHAVTSYSVWMRPPNKAAPVALDAKTGAELAATLGCGTALLEKLTGSGWTYVEQVPAMMNESYGCLAPTYGDSIENEPNPTEYCVVAHGGESWLSWESAPMTGSSVDNLSPAAPLALAGAWSSYTEVTLQWSPSGLDEPDLAGYRVYRGESAGFEPAEANRIAVTTWEMWIDDAGADDWYYVVTAVDVHGNESPVSNEVELSSLSAVPESPPRQLALHANCPNPFNPITRIAFDLPVAAPVDLGVYAVDGTRVATLARGTWPAGGHEVVWRGADDAGRAQPSGVYFYRLVTEGWSETGSMVLVR